MPCLQHFLRSTVLHASFVLLYIARASWVSVFSLSLLGLVLPVQGFAAVTDATPVTVGSDYQYYEAGAHFQPVVHIPIVTDGSNDTLTDIEVTNDYYYPSADEPTDIVPNSVKLWYAPVDSGNFSTPTAQFVGTLTRDRQSTWKISGLSRTVANGSALYVTIDISSAPTPDITCAFQVYGNMLVFSGGGSFPGAVYSPDPPAQILLTQYSPASRLDLSHTSSSQVNISTGQPLVPMILTATHPGSLFTAPVFLSGLTLTVRDPIGSVISPDTVWDQLSVRDADSGAVIASGVLIPSAPEPVYLPLSVSITAGELRHFEVFGKICSNTITAAASFRLELSAAGNLSALDAYTGSALTVSPVGEPFPMQTPLFAVQKSARQLLVYHTSVLPADAVVLRGQTNNHALNLTFMNPGATGTARVDITRLILAVTDATGASLSPAAAFSRVAVGGGQLYGETTDMPSSGNLITLMLGNSYCPVPVYQPVTISVLVDIKPDAQATAFRISLPNAVAVRAQDANSLLAVPVSNTCVPYASLPDPFPMSSPLVRVASSFQVSGLSLAPKNIYPNQRTDLLQLVLTHPGPAELGTLLLNGLTLTAQEAGGSPLDPAQDLTALWVTDTNAGLLSQVRAPELGEQTFIPLPSLPIAPFSSITIRIGLEAGATFSHATLRLGLLDGLSILASQPLDPTRPVVSIGSWPLMSAAASLGGGEGRLRVSNYPNPFSPGRQPTRIAYYLEQPGLATAVLYTLLGDEVKLFFLEENQAIGEHTLIWDGRTSGGAAVVNGIYLLRLQVKFHGSGETVTQIRKIAVVK